MNPPLFSVIIPTFNRLAYLQDALASVWGQGFTDYEVIVVDDGSTDGTAHYLLTLGSRIRALSQTNKGPGAARNRGIEAAQGDYLAFLDSDDVWFSWTLATYASVIRNAQNPAFVTGKPFQFHDVGDATCVSQEPERGEQFADYLASGDLWRWWGVSSFVIRRDVIERSGGFAEANMNGEDSDLALRIGQAIGFVQVLSPFTFGYRQHSGNLTTDLSKTLIGIWHKIGTEAADGYPGGEKRAIERRRILTRHVRPVALACLGAGLHKEAWSLYRATLSWHVRLSRWKFVLGFPIQACLTR